MPILMLLDLVEVALSHTGINLAAAFTKILGDFRILDKISVIFDLSFKSHKTYCYT